MTAQGTGSGPAKFPHPFGKYTLLSHLAVGGMADVFLAQHKGPAGFEKECVIKRILPQLGLDEEFVHMFLDEARIAARLSHPNIVQIFDLGQVDGDYFLAMEYVDGVNMEQLLQAVKQAGEPAIPWPVAVRIVADVAAGLDHAHNVRDGAGRALKLVHRDVSPSNVMVSWGGVAKILDFGIAKAVVKSVKRASTQVGTIKGKIPYMSPEQLQGLTLDARSDIFSLGVLLYEVVCGARPFPGETAAQITMQILHDDPRPPELHLEAFPKRLGPILSRALAKQPGERWQSARDFQLALEQLLTEEHTACTVYDVEAYLRARLPEGRRSVLRSQVSGTEQTEVSQPLLGRVATPQAAGREAQMEKPRDGEPARSQPAARVEITGLGSGPAGRLSDLGQGFDEIEAEESLRRRKGGGGLITSAIVILVLLTGLGLYVVRDYFTAGRAAGVDLSPGPAAGAVDLAASAPPDLLAPHDAAARSPVPNAPARMEPVPREPPRPQRSAEPARPRPAVHPERRVEEGERPLPRLREVPPEEPSLPRLKDEPPSDPP